MLSLKYKIFFSNAGPGSHLELLRRRALVMILN